MNIYMNIIFLIKYILYKNAHDRNIFIFLNVIIFLKIGCANLDVAPISPLLSYTYRSTSCILYLSSLKWSVGWA